MITLAIILIILLAIAFAVIGIIGGATLILLDPIIALVVIWLIMKLIKYITK